MRKDRNDNSEKAERASGDVLTFFLLHNLFSVFYFFVVTIAMGIYSAQDEIYGYTWIQLIGYLISSNFWELTIFRVFPICILAGVAGRITAFYGIKACISYRDRKLKTKRATKKWSELTKGINRMGIKFVITSLLTSFIYTVGLITMLSYALFNEATLLPLIIAYSVVKIGTHFFVRWIVGSKL